MKRKLMWLLLIVVPLSIFLAARDLASWRPQTISAADFQNRLYLGLPNTEVPAPSGELQSAFKKRLALLAKSKGWEALSFSPDKKQLLVRRGQMKNSQGAILSASDGRVLARLRSPNPDYFEEGFLVQWSPDSRLMAAISFGAATIQIFDAQSGAYLWKRQSFSITGDFVFSPDGQFAASPLANGDFVSVCEARSGREIKRLREYANNWNFSRDSNYLLAEIAPDEYRQLRLR